LGRGKRLFELEDINGRLKMKLVNAKPFKSGVVAHHYMKL